MANATKDANVAAKDKAREDLARVFQPNSPIAAVFICNKTDKSGNTPALFVNAGAEVPEIITYMFGPAGLFGPAAEFIAEDAHVDLDDLTPDGYAKILARSVAIAACSSVRVPGVKAVSISTRPAMDSCKRFAESYPVGVIETVPIARSRRQAYKLNKLLNPERRKKQPETMFDADFVADAGDGFGTGELLF